MMHAPFKSHTPGAVRAPRAVPAPCSEMHGTLVRTAIALIATATLLFLFTPSVIRAQDRAGLHTVTVGESLWSLATQFYGDGRRWTELAKLNDLGDPGAKQLIVGQVIRVPEVKTSPSSAIAVTPPPNTPRPALMRALQPIRPPAAVGAAGAASTGARDALAAQTAGRGDAVATATRRGSAAPRTSAARSGVASSRAGPVPPPAVLVSQPTVVGADSGARDSFLPSDTRVWAVDLSTQRGARGTEPATVFLGRTFDAVEVDVAVKALLPPAQNRPRSGEYASAPYAVASSTLLTAGTVGQRSGAAVSSFQDLEQFTLRDDVVISLPAGLSGAPVGSRFVSVNADALLPTGVQVVVPTGVLEIMQSEVGRPVVARVLYQSGRIQEGQHLFALEGQAASADVRPTSVPRSASAPEAEVVWVESGALLPSLQSFLLLNAGEAQGVKAGDEYAIVKRMGLGADTQEQSVALVRVVRVTTFGSSAIVIHQDQARIAVGGPARLVARVGQ